LGLFSNLVAGYITLNFVTVRVRVFVLCNPLEMEKNQVQEKKCYDLLRRISLLQIKEVHAYAQEHVSGFSSQRKEPATTISEELEYTRLVLGGVLKDVPDFGGDETESSSEEESCDELEIGTRKIENYLSV
jgi:hypothetical protein